MDVEVTAQGFFPFDKLTQNKRACLNYGIFSELKQEKKHSCTLALDVWLIGGDFDLLNCVETGRVITAK